MKTNLLKRVIGFFLATMLMTMPVFSAMAEEAAAVQTAGGRSIVVQNVTGPAGKAEVLRGDASFAPSAGVRLMEGDIIKTTGDTRVYIAVDSNIVLRLDEGSEAIIKKAVFGQKLTVNVKSGKMFYNVAKQSAESESLELMSNNITIAIRGTSGVLTFGNGKIQHQLYDGVVTVSDGLISRTQNPGEFLTVSVGPSSTLENSMEVKSFGLSEIPASVVEEMKKDAGLMARILASVPLSVGADGSKKFADEAYFNENIAGISDVKVFSASLKEIRETGSGSSNPAPVPPAECPYAHGKELFYIIEVLDPGNTYKTFMYRYNDAQGKFVLTGGGAGTTSFTGYDYKAGDWVHWDWGPSKELGFCTHNGDGAEIPVMHTVKFDMNGQTVDYPPEDREVVDGQTVWKPSVRDTNCCTFDGWYTEKECLNTWDFDTPVTKDMTLYAHWLPKTMTIWMQAGSGGTGGPESVDLTYGDKLQTLSSLPTHSSRWTFLGYFTPDDDKIFDAEGKPVSGAEDLIWSKYSGLTIYAHWQDPSALLSSPSEPVFLEELISEEAGAPVQNDAEVGETGGETMEMVLPGTDEEMLPGTAEEYGM